MGAFADDLLCETERVTIVHVQMPDTVNPTEVFWVVRCRDGKHQVIASAKFVRRMPDGMAEFEIVDAIEEVAGGDIIRPESSLELAK